MPVANHHEMSILSKPGSRTRKPVNSVSAATKNSRGGGSRNCSRGKSRSGSPKRTGKPRFRWLWKIFWILTGLALIFLVSVDVYVRVKFSGSKWSLPAHVYSRSLDIYAGLPLPLEKLRWELDRLGYRPVSSVTGSGQYRAERNRIELFTRPFLFWDGEEPARHLTLNFDSRSVTRLQGDAGEKLAVVRLEPVLIGGIYPELQEDRVLVRLEQLPPHIVDGLVAVEDQGFYSHHGISPKSIARAFVTNLRAGSTVQGGSTITQQLVKNFYLTSNRSLLRKGMEAIMALLLELHASKAEIMEAYVNEVFLGQSGRRAIHGFGLASRHYFRQPVEELELHQEALLIGLVKGASYYDPWSHPERARKRRDLVIDILLREKVIDEAQATAAKRRDLDVAGRPGSAANPYPDYIDLVKRQLRKDYREQDLDSAGLRVFTHFDPQVQREVEETIASRLDTLEKGYRIQADTLEAAAILVRVGTAEVLAVAGGRESGYAGYNRALDARRQVGSTIKPAVYLAALEQPELYSLASLIDDGPVTVKGEDGKIWSPQNYERKSHGLVPMYQALGNSYNQATARLGMDVGLEKVADTIHRLGYEGSLPEVPSLLLGSVTMSPFDLAGIYHTIAAQGFLTPLRAINAVYTADNQPLKRYPFAAEQRFDPGTMHLLQYALQVVMREGTGKTAYRYLPEDLSVAGKTGTSNDQRDSWFAGFSGNYLGIVWIGRDDNGKMPLTGGTGALQVWGNIMARIDSQPLAFVKPENIEYHWVEPANQWLSAKGCPGARYLPFDAGTAPSRKGPCYRAPGRNLDDVVDWFKDLFGL